MKKVLSAIVAGHICLDIIPEMQLLPSGGFKETFLSGHLLEVGAAALCTGGSVSNTGLALHRLGIPTQLICKVGADAFGRIRRELIDSYVVGLEPSNCRVEGRAAERTSGRLKFLQPGEVRRYAIEVEFFEPKRGAQ
jgi:sugar/nucleoside kinase (ribokinase family)